MTNLVAENQNKRLADRILSNLTYQVVTDARNGTTNLTIESYVEEGGGDGCDNDVEVIAKRKGDGIEFTRELGGKKLTATLSKKQVDSCELYTKITLADLLKYYENGHSEALDCVHGREVRVGPLGITITQGGAKAEFSNGQVKDALIPLLRSNEVVLEKINEAAKYLNFKTKAYSTTLKKVNCNGIVVANLVIEKAAAGIVKINGLAYQGDDLAHLLDDHYKPKDIGIGTADTTKRSAPQISMSTLQTWANVELGSAVLRSAAALTVQQLQRVCGDDSKMALISSIVLDALRVTNDLLATNNEFISGRVSVVDGVALALVGADLFDIYEKAMQLKNGKKSDVASEDVAEDVKDASEEAKVSAKSVNKLAALFKQAAPALESICVMVCGIAKYENADADLLRLAYYSRLALSAIRSVNMILTTDAKSIKRKAAYTIGALTVIGFIVDLIVKKSGGAGKGGKGAGANGTEVIIKAGDTKLPVEILNMVA
jgi:hypothetical protein